MGAVTSCCGHDEDTTEVTVEELLKGPHTGIGNSENMKTNVLKEKGQQNNESIGSPDTTASTTSSFSDCEKANSGDKKALPSKSPRSIAIWRESAEQSISVNVVFPDGHRITCDFQLDMATQTLFLTFNKKVRSIELSDIGAVLYGSDCGQLDEAERDLLQDLKIVGIKLKSSGRAIAFSFSTLHSAECFVLFCNKLLPLQ